MMKEPEKITIVEGPPPTFEHVADAWFLGITEGSWPSRAAMCRVRAFNGPELVERCERAWGEGETIKLEYRTTDGLTEQAPIIAIRRILLEEGDTLMIWVRMEAEVEIEIDLELSEDDLDIFGDDYEDDEVDFNDDLSI